jgi:feruloyl esterase
MQASAMAKVYEAANPDISAFVDRGGKLIVWHGLDDPGPSALHTIEYWDQMQMTTGARLGLAKVSGATRLFLAPGVHHCSGGPGPDRFDRLAALENWVERGRPPQRIVATKTEPPMSRPLCAYPALPAYAGKGDPDDETSFRCERVTKNRDRDIKPWDQHQAVLAAQKPLPANSSW